VKVSNEISPIGGSGGYKVTGLAPIDVAAHLTLLGESLTIIGDRLLVSCIYLLLTCIVGTLN